MIRTALAATACALALASAPASAEVTKQTDDMFVVRSEATVKSDAKATWLALIAPAKWWNKAHTWSGDAANLTLTPQGGGCFCERIPERDSASEVGLAGSAQHMTVVQAFPMRVLRMRGALGPLQSEPVEGVLTITLKTEAEGGTHIVWEYAVGGPMRYEVPTIAKAVDGVIAEQVERLAAFLGPTEAAPAAVSPAPEKPASVEDALDAMGKGRKPAGKQ